MTSFTMRVCGTAVAASAMLLSAAVAQATDFRVALPEDHEGPVTGRLLLALSETAEEPRRAIAFTGASIFGLDVEGLAPGEAVTIDASATGFPMETLGDLAAGEYHVQAVLQTYQQVTRADGHTIWVPVPETNTFFFFKPGNLFSPAQMTVVDPAADDTLELTLSETIPPAEEPEDSEWIKHVKIRSDILSDFWGTDIYLGADVLLPHGYEQHPDARYPVVFPMTHWGAPFNFNPDPESDTERARASAADANLKTGHQFYQEWVSSGFPRMVAIALKHPSPYFIESYSLNSANNGPYGDAITQELIPYLEEEFRLIGEPYARIVEGASTGGWEALALQLHYPDYFGGAWVFNPDPVSFRHYQLANIYEDENMFTVPTTDYFSAERPFRRTREGQPVWTTRQLSRFEAVLGTKGRSGYQLGIWQATHGPVGEDGYPVPLFDPLTGGIDHEVANYYRENGYDLTEYARANWETLGPKLAGKLNFFSGEMDEFYLNLGVYDFQDMIEETAEEDYPIRFEYGRPKKGHNWHHTDWAGVVREMAEQVRRNAPDGADNAQWNY